MKKMIAVALTFFITGHLLAQAGRIKITFLGFKCYRETWDDILDMDGRGDEVFFQFSISRADQRGNVRQKFDRQTSFNYLDAQKHFRPISETGLPRFYMAANQLSGVWNIDFMSRSDE